MKNHITVSAVLLGMSALGFSAGAFCDEVMMDPVTGVVQGTANVVSSSTNALFGLVPGVGDGLLVKSDNGYIASGYEEVRPGIYNNDKYLLQSVGSKTTITDMNTGHSYWVKGVKSGVMDVNDGNGVTRYQYNTYMVKPK